MLCRRAQINARTPALIPLGRIRYLLATTAVADSDWRLNVNAERPAGSKQR